MKITKPNIEIVEPTGYDLISRKKHIEKCGRICYKSEGSITEDSYDRFIDMLIKSGHTSVLEHGTIYLTVPREDIVEDLLTLLSADKYTKTEYENNNYYITTNSRVLINLVTNKKLTTDRILKYNTSPTKFHKKRVTVKFNTQIAISREFNRHRVNSVSEQSTRYCNFSKDKFENKLNINLPNNINEKDIINSNVDKYELMEDTPTRYDYNGEIETSQVLYEKEVYTWKAVDWWIWANKCAELAYMKLIDCGWKPQEARTILPLDTSTELVHTAFVSDWIKFLKLRSPKCGAKGVHPDAAILADKLFDLLLENKYISISDIKEF